MRYSNSRHPLSSRQCSSTRRTTSRRGAIAVQSAVVGAMVLGMTALSIDVGYMALTRTQLQAAADAATLAGGVDLFSGLGASAIPAADVEIAAKAAASTYAAANANGDRNSTYIAPDRDVTFGWTVWDNGTSDWQKNWNAELPGIGGYNMIRVTTLRDQNASANGDGPLSLLFARIMGRTEADLKADATAIIVPANGITITPGSDETANAMPFAYRRRLWEKYLVAQQYYEVNGFPADFETVFYYDDQGNPYQQVYPPGATGGDVEWTRNEPLFGHYADEPGNQPPTFQQDYYDRYSCSCNTNAPTSAITETTDNWLEFDAYPRDDFVSGNFGTIDIGSASNGTPDLIRQILFGINAADMSHYTDNTLTVPFTTGGDTGISAAIKTALDTERGKCKAVFMVDDVRGQGDTSQFDIVGMAGVRIMYARLTGALTIKELSLQYCEATLDGATGDYDDTIGVGDTVFTPLILIE